MLTSPRNFPLIISVLFDFPNVVHNLLLPLRHLSHCTHRTSDMFPMKVTNRPAGRCAPLVALSAHAPPACVHAVAAARLKQQRSVQACAAESIFELDYDISNEDPDLTSNWKPVIKVAISGAAGQISNHLLFMLASGEVYGKDQPLELRLLGSVRSKEALEGVAMELEDSLYPLLRSVKIGIEAEEVFADADWALLIGAKPRGPGMERADLLDLNGQIFEVQGKALDKVRSRCSYNVCKCCASVQEAGKGFTLE